MTHHEKLVGTAMERTLEREQWGRNRDAELGYGVLRLTLGIDFLFHSASRWTHIREFAGKVVGQFASTPPPAWSVRDYAAAITILEPIVGALLVIGFHTRDALVAGGLLIVTLVFGTALRGDFTVLTEQLIYALLFFVLLLYRQRHDYWSLDRLLAGRLHSYQNGDHSSP